MSAHTDSNQTQKNSRMPIMQQETQVKHCHFAIAKMSWIIFQVVTEDAKIWSEKSKKGKS